MPCTQHLFSYTHPHAPLKSGWRVIKEEPTQSAEANQKLRKLRMFTSKSQKVIFCAETAAHTTHTFGISFFIRSRIPRPHQAQSLFYESKGTVSKILAILEG